MSLQALILESPGFIGIHLNVAVRNLKEQYLAPYCSDGYKVPVTLLLDYVHLTNRVTDREFSMRYLRVINDSLFLFLPLNFKWFFLLKS